MKINKRNVLTVLVLLFGMSAVAKADSPQENCQICGQGETGCMYQEGNVPFIMYGSGPFSGYSLDVGGLDDGTLRYNGTPVQQGEGGITSSCQDVRK